MCIHFLLAFYPTGPLCIFYGFHFTVFLRFLSVNEQSVSCALSCLPCGGVVPWVRERCPPQLSPFATCNRWEIWHQALESRSVSPAPCLGSVVEPTLVARRRRASPRGCECGRADPEPCLPVWWHRQGRDALLSPHPPPPPGLSPAVTLELAQHLTWSRGGRISVSLRAVWSTSESRTARATQHNRVGVGEPVPRAWGRESWLCPVAACAIGWACPGGVAAGELAGWPAPLPPRSRYGRRDGLSNTYPIDELLEWVSWPVLHIQSRRVSMAQSNNRIARIVPVRSQYWKCGRSQRPATRPVMLQ